MSSEFDMYFQQFLDRDQEPFDINEYCNASDYMVDPTLEAQTLDHPVADAGNEFFDPDASVGVLEPNQASLHTGPSAMVPESNQLESADKHHIGGSAPPNMEIASSGPPYKCTEANCRSKAQFKTMSQFRQHVRNIHQQPLLCTWRGCTHRRPFGKEADLDRHVKSRHEATRPHICPGESCLAHVDGFKRKDKLTKHLREDHPQVQCTQTHCSAVVADVQQQSHMDEAHGPFECAIGHCGSSPPSNFTEDGLTRHLRAHHKLRADAPWIIKARMKRSGLNTARLEHLNDHPRRPIWEICSVCELGGVTAPISGDV